MRRTLIALALGLAAGLSAAQTQPLVLGVSEGTSGGLDSAQVVAKYQGLADLLARVLKQKVNVIHIREFANLEDGMKSGRLDFVMARPSDYPARGLRDHGYQFVATARPDGQCHLIVHKDSAIKSLDDAKGKKIVLPEKTSYMARFCSAELRDRGIDVKTQSVQYVREQAAVAFYLEQKLADVGGVASYSGVAKKWEKDGHRVIHKSVPQPYFPLIASGKLPAAQVAALQAGLRGLPSDAAGQELLKAMGLKEFDTSSEGRLRELLKWLGA